MEENTNQKFSFDLEFQETILRFIVNNDDGYKAMEYVRNSYFSLLPHTVICYALERLWKSHSRIPSQVILLQSFNDIFNERRFLEALTQEDQDEIRVLAREVYNAPAKDGDILLEEIAKFASFVELKTKVETLDLEDFSSYSKFASGVQEAISISNTKRREEEGIYFIRDIRERQMNRQAQDIVIPTPFPGINRLTNAGGYEPGSIIVILDQPKRLKTAALINIARGYLRQKKKVIFFDLENGEESLVTRLEQSVGRVTKREIIKGIKDAEIQKVLRRYKRLGGEVYIKRIPAFSTTTVMQAYIDKVYRDTGMIFNDIFVDYVGLMGSLSGKTEDNARIGDAYLDMANLVEHNRYEHCWTAHHLVRGARKREGTKYEADDVAKCIDIIRHVQAVFGLNRTPEEYDNGLVRLEIVDQRDGVPSGRAYFRVEANHQRMDELTKREIEEFTEEGLLYDPNRSFGGDPEPPVSKTGDM